jgi:hypothetical protein
MHEAVPVSVAPLQTHTVAEGPPYQRKAATRFAPGDKPREHISPIPARGGQETGRPAVAVAVTIEVVADGAHHSETHSAFPPAGVPARHSLQRPVRSPEVLMPARWVLSNIQQISLIKKI